MGESNADILINSSVFFVINHGRLSHWIRVATRLFALALQRGLQPNLYNLPSNAFQQELTAIFERTRTNRSLNNCNLILLRSIQSDFFFSSKFDNLLNTIDSNLPYQAKQNLARELKPLACYLANPSPKLLEIHHYNNINNFYDSTNISLHLRRGDVAVLFRNDYISTDLENVFHDDVFLLVSNRRKLMPNSHRLYSSVPTWTFISETEWQEIRLQPYSHSAYWFQNRKDPDHYLSIIDSIEASNKKVVLFSDGYKRAAMALSRHTADINAENIEKIIEAVEFKPYLQRGYRLITGEPSPCMGFCDLLRYALNADLLIAEESGFPKSFIDILKMSLSRSMTD